MTYKKKFKNIIVSIGTLALMQGCSKHIDGYFIPREEHSTEVNNTVVARFEEKRKDLSIQVVSVNKSEPIPLSSIPLNSVILFSFGSSKITSDGKQKLIHLSNELKIDTREIEKITIHGYTDRIGDKNFNQMLSQKRAQNIANYLKKLRVGKKIDVVGKGAIMKSINQCKGKGSALIECLKNDRRVEITILTK